MKAIFLREARFGRRMLILWTAIIAFMILFFSVEYPMVSGSVDELDAIMDMMPTAFGVMMGIYPEVSIGEPAGFYYCMFLWCALVGNFYAAMLGANLLSMDEKYGTSEFIYTKPFGRRQVIRAKLYAGLLCLGVITFVAWLFSTLFMNVFVGGEGLGLNGGFALSMLGLIITELIFMVMGMMFSAVVKKPGLAMRLSLINVLVSYMLSVAIKTAGAEFLSFLSPFWYFNAPDVMTRGLSPLYLLLAVLIVGVSLLVTFRRYGRRDLAVG